MKQFLISVGSFGFISASKLKPPDSVDGFTLRFFPGDRDDTHHCILYDKVDQS